MVAGESVTSVFAFAIVDTGVAGDTVVENVIEGVNLGEVVITFS